MLIYPENVIKAKTEVTVPTKEPMKIEVPKRGSSKPTTTTTATTTSNDKE